MRAGLSLFALLLSFCPITALAEDLALCSAADIKAALGDSPVCSANGVVVFGLNPLSFVSSQCQPLLPAGSTVVPKSAYEACIACVTKSARAFKAAVQAGVLKGTVAPPARGAVRSLCGSVEELPDPSEGGAEPDTALKSLFAQLALCIPTGGAASDSELASCKACADSVISNGVASNVLTQTKAAYLRGMEGVACRKPKAAGDGTGGGNQGGGHGVGGTPTPTPTPNSGEEANRAFFSALRGCIEADKRNPNVELCHACVNAVSTSAVTLNPTAIARAKSYANDVCDNKVTPGDT